MQKNTSILNVSITNTNYSNVIKRIIKIIKLKQKKYICIAAVHLVMECQNNQKLLKGVNNSSLITLDGVPLVWISKLYGAKNIERVYGPDLMLKTCQLAEEKNYNIFLLGGKTGQSQILRTNLQKKYPKLKIVGNIDTPSRPITNHQSLFIIQKINKSHSNIVFVGLGCPWQELWMIKNRKFLKPQILIGVGAAFDFITNYKKQAPKWVQNIGLEWLFRFIQEPKRLWYRYLILNSQFIIKISKQLIYDFIIKKI
jgi:N-acetylglucosaminyldiphosphoundecaprenol N-acetyl-beta-D-mannosaminyltransferase